MSSKPMALARAFTKRTKRSEDAPPLSRGAGSVRYAPGTIRRNQISLPTELISTTNMHALNAPDIRGVSTSSSNSSLRSADESDSSAGSRSFLDSPMTTPDTSSVETSPITPDHFPQSSFFDAKVPKRSVTSVSTTRSTSSISSSDAPAIPQRALSHSKRAHQEVARKRSISRMSPPPTTMPTVDIARDSAAFFTGAAEPAHPFGKELAQVNEVAEEFGAVASVLDEEEQVLLSKGLCKFGVEDYLNEIEELYGGVYEDRLSDAWI